MGFYHETPPDESDEQRPGCLDTLFIIRLVLGVLFWPIVAIVFVLVDLALIVYFLTTTPVLAIIPLGVTAMLLVLLARWEARRERPPDHEGPPP